MESSKHVLDFWFGELDENGFASKARSRRWWKKSPDFDSEVRDRFLADWEVLMAGGHQDWLESTKGTLAAVIVLDQGSRNMYRGTGQMFAADEMALELVKKGCAAGLDQSLEGHERVFFYMPFMHSESLEDQDRCVRLFTEFAGSVSGQAREKLMGNVKYAEKHRFVIEQFGRFPHRNKLLGRESTEEETAFLKQPGSRF